MSWLYSLGFLVRLQGSEPCSMSLLVHRELRTQGEHLLPHFLNLRIIAQIVEDVTHPGGQLGTFRLAETAGRNGR
jgi:hypothetical protein